jgi:hypothetical protein
MLPFGVTIPATVPQGSEIPEGLINNPVFIFGDVFIQIIILHIETSEECNETTDSKPTFFNTMTEN